MQFVNGRRQPGQKSPAFRAVVDRRSFKQLSNDPSVRDAVPQVAPLPRPTLAATVLSLCTRPATYFQPAIHRSRAAMRDPAPSRTCDPRPADRVADALALASLLIIKYLHVSNVTVSKLLQLASPIYGNSHAILNRIIYTTRKSDIPPLPYSICR